MKFIPLLLLLNLNHILILCFDGSNVQLEDPYDDLHQLDIKLRNGFRDLIYKNESSTVIYISTSIDGYLKTSKDILSHMNIGDLRIIVPKMSLSTCTNFEHHKLTCCSFDLINSCYPPVIDYLVTDIDENIRDNNEQYEIISVAIQQALVLVRGGVLAVSDYKSHDHDHHDINTIVNSKTTGLPTHLISNFSKIDINLPSSIGSLYSLYFRSYSGDRNFDTLIYNDDNNDDGLLQDIRRYLPTTSNPRSKVSFNMLYGMNYAELSHVCLLNQSSILLLHGSRDEGSVIPPSLKMHLNKPYSGFAGLFPGYTGYDLIEQIDYENKNKVINDRIWIGGTTALVSASVGINIYHWAQVCTSLAAAAIIAFEHIQSQVLSNSTSPQKNNFKHKNKHRYHATLSINRIIAPTVPRWDLDWTHGTLNVLSYILAHLTQLSNKGSESGKSKYDYHHENLPRKPIHLAEDVAAAVKAVEDKGKHLCFERMILAGATDLQTPMLMGSQGNWWRAAVYYMLSLSPSPPSSISSLSSPSSTTDSSSTFTELSPNHALKVTVLIRKSNGYNIGSNHNQNSRQILNVDALLQFLLSTGVVDQLWLQSHVIAFDEDTSFRDQVQIMKATDIFIAPHGAGLTNALFMQAHSAIIEVFTAPWYENGYSATAMALDLHYGVVTLGTNKEFYCADNVSSDCFDKPLLVNRSELSCLGLRSCSANIDLNVFEGTFWVAVQHVRIIKRGLHKLRVGVGVEDNGRGSEEYDIDLDDYNHEDNEVSDNIYTNGNRYEELEEDYVKVNKNEKGVGLSCANAVTGQDVLIGAYKEAIKDVVIDSNSNTNNDNDNYHNMDIGVTKVDAEVCWYARGYKRLFYSAGDVPTPSSVMYSGDGMEVVIGSTD